MCDNIKKILLVGAGAMSLDYVKVFKALNLEFEVVGRSVESALTFEAKSGISVVQGGLANFLKNKASNYYAAVVATGVEALYHSTQLLIEFGITNILVEKPGGLNKTEIIALSQISKARNANLFIAYNRRFYESTLKAKELIEADGGIISFNFEFTEWAYKIAPLQKGKGVKENWFLSNSSHVADLAFHLGGKPINYNCYTKRSLDWHVSASVFAGSGETEKGALFSYNANWEAPGRWAVEFMTQNFRFIFKPLEQLSIIKRGQLEAEKIALNGQHETELKPGLFLQTKAFVNRDYQNLCNIHEQAGLMDLYCDMANYHA